MTFNTIKFKGQHLGKKDQLFFIVGPCVLEGEKFALSLAETLKKWAVPKKIPLVFKASFDKANRSSIKSFRGPGLEEGLRILEKVRCETGLPVITDVHEPNQVPQVSQVADIIQIPAFLCRQTDLIVAAANSGKPVNIKKGQFLAPWDMKNVVSKAEEAGVKGLMLTERGTCFGYNNLVSDLRSLPILLGFGYPVIFDATHSLQLPGGRGQASGGLREHIPALARASVVVGARGLFAEVHPNPVKARCDRETVITPQEFFALAEEVIALHKLLQERGPVSFSTIDFNKVN